jgi:hypothetical protein
LSKNYEIAVYYFPNYHPDARNEVWHYRGWTEWEVVKNAKPRFEGHQQPKIPMWGYEDESKPSVMKKKIAAAADHCIDTFIFDWYWYEDGPFLQRALEEGFMKAGNNNRIKFTIMWANHDWRDVHPAVGDPPYKLLANGLVSPRAFTEATNHIISTYFTHPSYWRVDGGLYFSVYHVSNLVKSFGNVAAAREALDDFRERVRSSGLGELHLNAVIWDLEILPGEEKVPDVNTLMDVLNFDSITSYVWIHHNAMQHFPTTSYPEYRDLSVKDYEKFARLYDKPYFPNVTVGWDSTPRNIRNSMHAKMGFKHTPVLVGNTPDEFEKTLRIVKNHLDRNSRKPGIFTINAWNEWTEGSYLEPDTINGMKYLEAIRNVFGD